MNQENPYAIMLAQLKTILLCKKNNTTVFLLAN